MPLQAALLTLLVIGIVMALIWQFGEPGTLRTFGLGACIVLLVVFVILLVFPFDLGGMHVGHG